MPITANSPGLNMPRAGKLIAASFAMLLALLMAGPPLAAHAQTSPPAATSPAPAKPVEPGAASPAPPAAEKPPAAAPAITDGGEMRDIAAKPVLRLKGQSTWDNGFDSLKKSIASLETEARRLNLARNGQMMTHFVDSDDLGFTFEVLLPLALPAPADAKLPENMDQALSPAGRAIVFTHEGAYDEIDTAYEALTAWLDDKNLVSTGKFLEEYETIPEKSDDPGMKIRIIVFLK